MRLRGPPAPAPRSPTLAHALLAAAGHSSGVSFVDLHEREVALPWGEVVARAERTAAALAARGVAPGERVAIVLRTGPEFLDAFFGTWLAGAVPVPLYPPVRLGRMEEYLAQTARMLAVSGARLVVSSGAVRRLLGGAVARAAPALGCVDVAELAEGGERLARMPAPEDLGLVQFSSGSTVDPKAVALSHAALQAQADALMAAVRPDARDALVSWLPLYHDMGLIGCLLAAMSYPGPLVLIPPEHFLARPALWLRAIARHRGTISVAPSFAYAFCAERVADAELAGSSLASWRLALNGAEPVSADALRRFLARFVPYGFDPGAVVPVYGLSEAALAVTWSPHGRPLATTRLDPLRLARDGVVATGTRELVSVGVPIAGVEVELRDEGGAPAGEGRLGRVFVRGPSLMRGYLGDEAATRRALAGGWLDTGDLGFALGGELYLHGREKDVVIVRGANHAPEEFEAAVAQVAGVRPGCAVALGFTPEGEGEALAILAERGRREARADGALAAEIQRAVLERTGVAPHTVRLLAPGTLPRTSSGKLRRREALRRFLAGALSPPRRVTPLRLALELARGQLGLVQARLGRHP
ncbi:AMP-binding protein [Anaeromyxobacter sp. Fw109-5]|uniref:AMP-binding protein n=1 Tax=Anaeromyxobacter sp. (strain Fw109-5) TaxID=404589 RepID=UPI0000ED6E11|nr:AMP-binding protein [Anaeromyxobacter sp. Fw109-5]ABS28361.1 AMP-dependent synthetase and ligase [Anaeromyxobacter sp. Fw109-5]